MNQFSLDFDAPRPPEPAAAPVPVPAPAPVAVPAPEPAAQPSLEALAQRLEQDPDFRVLRRLVPIHDFGPRPGLPDSAGVRHVIVLDTETTGLSHASDKIIELAMLLVDVDVATGLPFGPVEIFEGFEDPGIPIPPIAKEVTGISDDMVQGQRLDDEQVNAMVDRADLVVAHNAGFDRPFVEARFPAFAAKPWACSFMDIDWRAAGAGSSKLSALAQDQGWFYDAHRAQVDCHALLQVLARPVGQGPVTGLSQLIGAAARPSHKLRATGAPFEAKDKLKGRGYRWDGEGRVWYTTIASEEAMEAELEWLRAEVYGRRSARLALERLDSLVRYSAREGERIEKAL